MARTLALIALAATASAVFKHKTIQEILLERPTVESTVVTPADEWFENQKLDHNDPSNNATWRQRYHVNSAWFGGAEYPVFLYINGENVADPTSTTSPDMFMNELAQKYKALVVSVEHRFYGQSQPRPDFTVDSLKYLTSYQALQDLVTVQQHIIEQRNLTSANKWVTFGGSYPGVLSGFAKAKFPKNFVGSVASSAPVWAKTNFVEYSEKVAYGLKFFGGDECLNNVGQAMKDFHALMVSTKQEDADLFKKLFNPCGPIKNDLDRAVLEVDMFGNFQSIAQYNGFQSFSLNDTCNFWANKSLTPLEKLASFNQQFSWDSRQCTGTDYETEWISGLNSTALDTENIERQWLYQTCNELGYGQTTAGSNSIFGVLEFANVNAIYYEMCKELFGITDTETRVANTLKFYGGLKVDVADVVWPGGTVDPWSALGFTNTTTPVNPQSDVVYIEGTAHCADMYSRADNLAPAWALDRIEANVKNYLSKK
ncbi:Thymus-specific serine protease [Aphanomyces cochlioides]|nr:Thymus-specific serine protease [Aphanomyces cochlioides]